MSSLTVCYLLQYSEEYFKVKTWSLVMQNTLLGFAFALRDDLQALVLFSETKTNLFGAVDIP